MKFFYRRILHSEKNKYPGIITSVIRYKDHHKYDVEKFVVKNDLTNPINLDDYELFFEELDKDRKILYHRLREAMSLLDSTPIIHFTDEIKKRKVFPGDRLNRLSFCMFSSSNEIHSPMYLEADTDEIFHKANIFPLTRPPYYRSKSKPRVGRPKKNDNTSRS